MGRKNNFSLEKDDYYAIDIAINLAKALLRTGFLESYEEDSMEEFLKVLDRLPESTDGVYYKLRLELEDDENYKQMRYIQFVITDNYFEISTGGKLFDGFAWGDDFSEPGWLVMVNGYRENDCDLDFLKTEVARYLDSRADIIINDVCPLENEDWL